MTTANRQAIRHRIISTRTRTVDKAAGLIEAVVSTEAKDRDGDIIRASGWDLAHFLANPVLLASHNYGDLRAQIGHWESMKVVNRQLVGVAKYYVGEGNEQADWGFNLASKGMAAYSVGFIPDLDKAKELDNGGWLPSFEFKGQELLEVSHVSVPSNPEALQLAVGKELGGLIHPAVRAVAAYTLQRDNTDDPDTVETKAHGTHDHDEKNNGRHEHDEKAYHDLDARLRLLEQELHTIKGQLDASPDEAEITDTEPTLAGVIGQW